MDVAPSLRSIRPLKKELTPAPLHSTPLNTLPTHSLGLSVMSVALGRFPYEEAASSGYWALLQALKENDSPTLSSIAPGKFSDDFNDFLRLCLTKDANRRPSADELRKVSERSERVLMNTRIRAILLLLNQPTQFVFAPSSLGAAPVRP